MKGIGTEVNFTLAFKFFKIAECTYDKRTYHYLYDCYNELVKTNQIQMQEVESSYYRKKYDERNDCNIL